VILNLNEKEITTMFKTECNWANAFAGYSTRNVIMEERNVFCGGYNVLVVKEKRDPHRVVHLNGSNKIAYGSFDKKIRFIELKTALDSKTVIQGHVGSIKCIYVYEKKGIVITGSYDTSIRYSILSGFNLLEFFLK
jgi:F-box/WD-40 domain protein 10